LHFADDTLLFIEATESNLAVLQWILIGFEQMSGMNINFSKCELIPFNITPQLEMTFASKLECKLDSLPITYLGFPLHNKKLSTSDWNFLVEKIEHKLQGWESKLLSYGGRITLLNSVISSIPLYWSSFFKIPSKIILTIDKLRKKILWYGENYVRKNILL
jgi:hypothetical protein